MFSVRNRANHAFLDRTLYSWVSCLSVPICALIMQDLADVETGEVSVRDHHLLIWYALS